MTRNKPVSVKEKTNGDLIISESRYMDAARHIRIPPELHEKIKELAKRDGKLIYNLSIQIIRMGITEYEIGMKKIALALNLNPPEK